jgi:hypothetical protein
MAIVKFSGRVLPEISNIEVHGIPPVLGLDRNRNLDRFSVEIEISSGKINVSCDIEPFRPELVDAIIPHAYKITRALIGMVSFFNGIGLTMLFDTLTLPDGVTKRMLPSDASLNNLCSAFSLGVGPATGLITVLELLMAEPPLWDAMYALTYTLEVPGVVLENCGRAIEILRHRLESPNESDRGRGWNELRRVLNIDKPYLNYISSRSTASRHGDTAHIAWSETAEVRRRAWIVMNRFLEFRKRGGVSPLPLAQFPVLTSQQTQDRPR